MIITLISCNEKEPESDFDKFTGRWKLYLVETQADSNASWLPRQGGYRNRQGFIIYDGKGGMGVHHVTEDYQNYEFEGKRNLDSLSRNDLRHLADNFVYFGKYLLNDSLSIIEHHTESANFQNMWGTVAKRNYVLSGDTLTLIPIRKGFPKTRLKWVRLNDLNFE